MATTEGMRIGDVIVWEENENFCRETLVVTSGQTLVVGEVCKTVSTEQVTAGAADGETICLEACDCSLAAGTAVFLVRNAVVDFASLTVSGSEAQAIAALKDVDATTGYGRIIVREDPTYSELPKT